MSMQTKVCSNQFSAGCCSDTCRIPTLYMKGFITEPTKRAMPNKRLSELPPTKRRQVYRDGFETLETIEQTPHTGDHTYDTLKSEINSRSRPFNQCAACTSKRSYIADLIEKLVEND